MKYRTLYLVLHTDKPVREDAARLRGYIGSQFPQYPILHHHADRPVLTYPRVQYKIIGGTPSILGIEEGADILKKISGNIPELSLGSSRYTVEQKVMYEKTLATGPGHDQIQYRFLSPWLALNSQNFQTYRGMKDWKEKKAFLNNILVGNFLSMAKGLGIVVERRLYAHTHIEEVPVMHKGIAMTGFAGEFRINFSLPDYFGIGKGVSHGFGTVKRVVHQQGPNPGEFIRSH